MGEPLVGQSGVRAGENAPPGSVCRITVEHEWPWWVVRANGAEWGRFEDRAEAEALAEWLRWP